MDAAAPVTEPSSDWRLVTFDRFVQAGRELSEVDVDRTALGTLADRLEAWLDGAARRAELFSGGEIFSRPWRNHLEMQRLLEHLRDGRVEARQDFVILVQKATNGLVIVRPQLAKLATPERWTAQHHVFVSYASADGDYVVSLVDELQQFCLDVWFDKTSMRSDVPVAPALDEGLAASANGVVVLSRASLARPWPAAEVDALFTREDRYGAAVLPVWHGVTLDEVAAVSPLLAARYALDTSRLGVADIAFEIARAIAGVAQR